MSMFKIASKIAVFILAVTLISCNTKPKAEKKEEKC